jgi:Leucine-rich repeat (LRR) protein
VTLEARNNEIHDLEPIKNCLDLEYLELAKNKVKDISPIKNLKKLKNLYLMDNQVTSIEVVENLTDLYVLILNNNQVKDISPVKKCVKLRGLYINNNQICDLRPLATLEHLLGFDAKDQRLVLNVADKTAPLHLYNIDGTYPELIFKVGTGSFSEGKLTWETHGENQLAFKGARNFTGVIIYEIPESKE